MCVYVLCVRVCVIVAEYIAQIGMMRVREAWKHNSCKSAHNEMRSSRVSAIQLSLVSPATDPSENNQSHFSDQSCMIQPY